MPKGDIRSDYFLIGATWTTAGTAPPGGQAGATNVANSTMETYQQGPDHNWFAQGNCFLCHRSNTTDVRHIFDMTNPLF